MSSFPTLEHRSLERRGNSPPDVYNQHDGQKEDIMSEDFVRDGYKYIKPVRDEYESCKKESKFVNIESIWKFYHNVLSKKFDSANSLELRKKQLPNFRDPVVPLVHVSDWIKELAGVESVHNLGRPRLTKDKKDILNELLTHKVPVSRAAWLINMSVIQSTAHAETTKRKPRAPFDPTGDWTNTLCGLLKRILEQLSDLERNTANLEHSWDYFFTLLIHLYDTDMADHWEVSIWLVKRAEALCNLTDSSGTELSIPLIQLEFFLQYLIRFGSRVTENELLTRRLLYWCCSIFSRLFVANAAICHTPKYPDDFRSILAEYSKITDSCPLHRSIVISLSGLISSLFLTLPSAAVWNCIPFETEHSYLNGSPVDHIPHSLSLLPMIPGPEAPIIRQCLFDVEELVITRSKLVEHGWKQQIISDVNGEELNCLVKVLSMLDQQDYNLPQERNPMEVLFDRIFSNDVNTSDLVLTLCEWTVSSHRVGIYRSIVVASLLEQLHATLQSDPDGLQLLQDSLVQFLDSSVSLWPPFVTDRAPIDNDAMRCLICLFSELIGRQVFNHDAYVRRMIARGVFNASFRPLAMEHQPMSQSGLQPNSSLGQSSRGQCVPPVSTVTTTNSSYPNSALGAQFSVASELSEDNDRCSIDNPDSVRSDVGGATYNVPHHNMLPPAEFDASLTELSVSRSPHFHYLAQFQLPQDESYLHEANQRYQLLYGSLRARDRGRCRIRQLARDINKLFTRKVCLVDVVNGEMCRRTKRSKDRDRTREQDHTSTSTAQPLLPPTSAGAHRPMTGAEDTHFVDRLHEDIMSRFVNLSYHDMECVISQCVPTLNKILSGYTNLNNPASSGDEPSQSGTLPNDPSPGTIGSNSLPIAPQTHFYMPILNSIFLTFELIEISLNFTCLLSTIVDTLDRLQVLFEPPRTPYMSYYMSSLCLRSVGFFQRYQLIFLTMPDLQCRLFPILIAQVRHISTPTQCRPFERCILIYLNDLYTSNYIIKTRFVQLYGKAHPKVSTLFRSIDPCDGSGIVFDPTYAADLLQATTLDNFTLFRAYTENLRSDPNSRYSFVCVALVAICQATTIERVQYFCDLCSELTSQCAELSPEWLGALYALLAPRPYSHGYGPIVSVIDPGDMNMYDNISSLIGTLLSRYYIMISDFLRRVICPVMAQGLDQPVGPELEPSIRLACHILHRLFTAESSVSSLQTTSANILTPGSEFSCPPLQSDLAGAVSPVPVFRISEPLLLTGALQKLTSTSNLLVDVLKMLMVHNDKACVENQSDLITVGDDGDLTGGTPVGSNLDDDGGDNESSGCDDSSEELDIPDDVTRRKRKKHRNLPTPRKQAKRRRVNNSNHVVHAVVQRFIESTALPNPTELRALSLSGLIQLVLREICTVSWVRERFYRMVPEELIRKNVLIDKNFGPNQARSLLHIIFHPFDLSWTDVPNLASAMCQVLSTLDLWTLHCAQMKFELLFAQIPIPQSDTLTTFAQSIVSGFQAQALEWLRTSGSGPASDGLSGPIGGLSHFELDEHNPVWLVSTLIANLRDKSVKIQIIKSTLETLQGIKHFWKHKNDEEKENVLLQHSVVLAHPAFFSLLQLCLEEVDPMDALYEQIDYFVENARETEDRVPDNLRTRQVVQECLRLRLHLAGQRFRIIPLNLEACSRWALLLTQLISHGVAEPESNSSLFYMIYDMLQGLVHALAAKSDLEGKHYQNFVKKARRELIERPPSYGIEQIKPLLPPLRTPYTVIVTGRADQKISSLTSSMNSSTVSGGNTGTKGLGKATGNKGSGKSGGAGGNGGSRDGKGDNQNRKRGLIVLGKERLAPWDVLDPAKQLFLLSWHGVTQIGAVPSRSEEQANRLIRHDHFIRMHRDPHFYLSSVYPELDYCEAQSTSTTSIQNEHEITSTTCLSTSSTSSTTTSMTNSKLESELFSHSNRSTMKRSQDSVKRPHLSCSGQDENARLVASSSSDHISYKFEADNSRLSPFTSTGRQQSGYPHYTESQHSNFGSSVQQRYASTDLPQYAYHSINPVEHTPAPSQESYYTHATPSKRRAVLDNAMRASMAQTADLPVSSRVNPHLAYPSSEAVAVPAPQPVVTTTKKKRGANRRTATASMERVVPANQRSGGGASMGLRPAGMKVDQQLVDPSLQTYSQSEYDTIINDQNWTNKPTMMTTGAEPTHTMRNPTQMPSIRGLIRNRYAATDAQQQQLKRVASSTTRQPMMYPPTYNLVRQPGMHDSVVPTGPTFDSSELGHYNTPVYMTTNESQFVGSYMRSSNDQTVRPSTITTSIAQRYPQPPAPHYNQQRVIVGEHPGQQQGVPNPPPYPVVQQPITNTYQPAQVQSSFIHNTDETYLITNTSHKSAVDEEFARTHHPVTHRHAPAGYTTLGHLPQQTIPNEQLIHHSSMSSSYPQPSVSVPRMVNPGHMIHSQSAVTQQQQQQHYARFPPY